MLTFLADALRSAPTCKRSAAAAAFFLFVTEVCERARSRKVCNSMSKPKLNNLGVRLDDDEFARLLKLAQHFGLRPTEVVRLVLKAEADHIMGANRQGAR